MKYALVSQFYWPHMGGAQKVVQELAQSLVEEGHEVEVITSFDSSRKPASFEGVKITPFKIRGNYATGMSGDISEFQNYLLQNSFDAIFVYAAQHWGLDAMIPILDKLSAKKVHVPCGYSGLKNPAYKEYFELMPSIIKKFDDLIYHSQTYQDYQFASDLGLKNLHLIPNAASEKEFDNLHLRGLRKLLDIDDNNKLFLTVGSPPFPKGHLDVLKVFRDEYFDANSVLVLNGCYQVDDLKTCFKEAVKALLGRSIFNVFLYAFYLRVIKKKKIFFLNLKREELISLMTEADVFLFMSHVEYSPLVLFETAAAGTPFVSVPCGNAREIADWTKAGLIAEKNEFLSVLKKLLNDHELYEKLSNSGKMMFKEKYNWSVVMKEYVRIIGASK